MGNQIYTTKQADTLLGATSRWNILCGATRSGKTFISSDLIALRLTQLPKGRKIMIGKTLSTLSYNVLEPMRDRFGGEHVSEIKTKADGIKYVIIFGHELRVVGANDAKAVSKIQGSGLVYAYGDEVATWDKAVFNMLKSRLDSKHAKFDGTTNPDAPNHWLKEFIDEAPKKGIDLKLFHYTIDDNTFLDPEFIEALKNEYRGTVYYDRFILGRWVAAEGSIYSSFIADKAKYIRKSIPEGMKGFISIGIDFGGNKSGHAFNATLIDLSSARMCTVMDYYTLEKVTPQQLDQKYLKFIKRVRTAYPQFRIIDMRADSAEQVLIRGMSAALIKSGQGMKIKNAIKGEINERIQFYIRMFGGERYTILKHCAHTIAAFEGAVWEDRDDMQDIRLDDGTSNIDTLDAQEYSTEPYQAAILKILDYAVAA